MMSRLRNQLIFHEGLRLFPYPCTAGKISIGVGRNLTDCGISKDEAFYLLRTDILAVLSDLHSLFPDFWTLPEPVRLVLADMRFNLGPSGFRSFKKMIAAVASQAWPRMRKEMKASAWFNQVGHRAFRLYEMIEDL